MRGFTVFILLIHLLTNAQSDWGNNKNQWNARFIQKEITDDFNRLSTKIYSGVLFGKLKIINFSNSRNRASILNNKKWATDTLKSSNSDAIISASIRKDIFTPFEGFVILIDSLSIDSNTIEEQLLTLDSLACRYKDNFIGWLDISTLNTVLNSQELSLFLAYRSQWKSARTIRKDENWTYLSDNPSENVLYGTESDKILVNYNNAILSQIFATLSEQYKLTSGFENKFYKDPELTESYDTISNYLFALEESYVRNPDYPLDPYDIIEKIVKTYISGIALQMIKIKKQNDDYLVSGYAESVETTASLDSWPFSETTTTVKKMYPIYFSYNSIRHGLEAHDQTILEELMQRIAR